jgi:predicted component of type VI protein secretion system
MTQDTPQLTPDLIEDAVARLLEAIAVLDVIDEGEMLSELPHEAGARRKHQGAVSLLAVLKRELIDLSRDLRAAEEVHQAIARATARDAK